MIAFIYQLWWQSSSQREGLYPSSAINPETNNGRLNVTIYLEIWPQRNPKVNTLQRMVNHEHIKITTFLFDPFLIHLMNTSVCAMIFSIIICKLAQGLNNRNNLFDYIKQEIKNLIFLTNYKIWKQCFESEFHMQYNLLVYYSPGTS